ncbi:LexA family transcriptional regulator [Entomomonas moraniae]|uniref:LexA family transcriptional regulator n=1 Tax=Entomomonas moraniae TaxID=2213226 RepID=A0A3Q9JHT4_9GAMM|nr:translesion error-prone DNA polymerase V autoproteolytic subunit [Entomomonas moraniae]AZS49808.1 LexA family transcriptional regulator [Entomomonas moraniae]
MSRKSSIIVLGSASISNNFSLPLVDIPVRAGFPSPADDYAEAKLELTEYLVQHPNATYYIRAIGDSMVDYGIFSGDLLIVDRSLDAKAGDVVIIAIDGELTCKKLSYIKGEPFLVSGNSLYPPIPLLGKEAHVWGVVIYNIHSLQGKCS